MHLFLPCQQRLGTGFIENSEGSEVKEVADIAGLGPTSRTIIRWARRLYNEAMEEVLGMATRYRSMKGEQEADCRPAVMML